MRGRTESSRTVAGFIADLRVELTQVNAETSTVG